MDRRRVSFAPAASLVEIASDAETVQAMRWPSSRGRRAAGPARGSWSRDNTEGPSRPRRGRRTAKGRREQRQRAMLRTACALATAQAMQHRGCHTPRLLRTLLGLLRGQTDEATQAHSEPGQSAAAEGHTAIWKIRL